MAVENGADEVDIVLNVGRMLTGEYDEAANEVEVIRTEMDDDGAEEGDHRVGSAENPRADPQGVAAVDAGRGRFREDLDGQDRRGRNARGRRGDVPGDPGLLRQNGPQGRFQGRRRGPHGRRRRALLHDRRGDTRQRKKWLTTEPGCSRHQPQLRPRTTFFRPSKARRSNTSNRHETGWRRSAGPFLADRPAPTHEKRRPAGPPFHTYRSRLTEANP